MMLVLMLMLMLMLMLVLMLELMLVLVLVLKLVLMVLAVPSQTRRGCALTLLVLAGGAHEDTAALVHRRPEEAGARRLLDALTVERHLLLAVARRLPSPEAPESPLLSPLLLARKGGEGRRG